MQHCALGIPEGISPIWLEGVVTSEYERDTLPLLFSSDEVYNEYYDALCTRHEGFRVQLESIKVRNKKAREMRSGGYWQECLVDLSQCLHLRRCVFDDLDYQYEAAVRHYVLTVLNFASFFLKEAKTISRAGARDQVLAKSFQLFKQAEEAIAQIHNPQSRAFFKAIAASNMANYFFRRRKFKAGSQQAAQALRCWGKAKIPFGSSFFITRDAVALCFREQYEEAARALLAAKKSEEGSQFASTSASDADFDSAPVRFNIQLLSNPMPITDAIYIVLHHNLCVVMLALRRHKEASNWCRLAMEVANSNSQHLIPTHPWVRAIKDCQAYCGKMVETQHFHKFKMKPSDNRLPEFQQMQKIITETRTMPVFHSLLQMHRKQIKEEKENKRKKEAEQQAYEKELTERKKQSQKLKGTTVYQSKENARPATTGQVRRRQPLGSLRLYLKEASYKQFVSEYMETKRAEQLASGKLLALKAPHPPDNLSDSGEGCAPRPATTDLPPVPSPMSSSDSV